MKLHKERDDGTWVEVGIIEKPVYETAGFLIANTDVIEVTYVDGVNFGKRNQIRTILTYELDNLRVLRDCLDAYIEQAETQAAQEAEGNILYQIEERVPYAIDRGDAHFDRAAEAAYDRAVGFFDVDEAGYINNVPAPNRSTDGLHVEFKTLEITGTMGGVRYTYHFEAWVSRNL